MSVRPKKHLGQHFLIDMRAADRIVALLEPLAGETVLEVGPGKGVLTTRLVAPGVFPTAGAEPVPVTAVEYDSEAAAYLRQTLVAPQFTLIEGDFMQVPLPDGPLAFIGNLPYNLTSPILFRVLEHRHQIRQGVVMVQREVAQRICAPVGTRECGLLSVLMAFHYRPEYGFTVPPGAFFPPPRVQSAVFRFTRVEPQPTLPFAALLRVVKAAFNQRRKMLSNALSSLGFALPPDLASRRAEQLSLDDFTRLVNAYLAVHPQAAASPARLSPQELEL
jgi:16S rRNA (adenine1518-N6/adenine1519-N6)-dimethyltransferase